MGSIRYYFKFCNTLLKCRSPVLFHPLKELNKETRYQRLRWSELSVGVKLESVSEVPVQFFKFAG
jgi:hypothetical protein